MGDFNMLENRQGLLQQSSSYTMYLPLFSSCIIVFYVTVYILRYFCWRIKQRRRKVRLLEYEKLRWLWHQKQVRLHYPIKEEKTKIDMDGEQAGVRAERYPYTRSSSSSLSVTTISDSKDENNTKMKAKQHQQHQKKCDYGDDSTHCRESSLIVTIPSPAYQPSHDHHSHSTKPRLPNQKTTTQLHHYHLQHQHQHSSTSSSSSSSSSTRKTSSQGHQRSFYSSSSSTTTLTCCTQQHRCKNEHHHLPEASPCLTSSPTTLSFSNPTSPSSSLKETPNLFYPSHEEKEDTRSHQDNRSQAHALASFFDKKNTSSTLVVASTPTTLQATHSSKFRQTYWPLYDTKAKRTRMIWKWSVAMGYCHYDHAKMITSIIEQLDPPPSQRLC